MASLEDGTGDGQGTGAPPQGAVISPLFANIYLHYVLDLWANRWRQTPRAPATWSLRALCRRRRRRVRARPVPTLERFLDDDARDDLSAFALALTPGQDPARLSSDCHAAVRTERARGLGKPETFNFLGFTQYHGRSRGKATSS